MKKLILLGLVFTMITGYASAQNASEGILKSKTKSNQSNDRTMIQDDESRVVKIRNTATGFEITFNQAIVSPRDAASGLPTGKRQHKPFVITKEYDKSSPLLAKVGSGGGSGKVSMSDLSVMFTSNGRTQKLPVTNGTFTLPFDGKDNDCDLVLSWSWGETQSGQNTTKGSARIKLTVQDGACVAISEKGTGATN
jgi:hypothetical protein